MNNIFNWKSKTIPYLLWKEKDLKDEIRNKDETTKSQNKD
jgi:hypothetical protein